MILLKIAILWLAIDAIFLATSWYASTIIKPRFPNWWKRNIVDDI